MKHIIILVVVISLISKVLAALPPVPKGSIINWQETTPLPQPLAAPWWAGKRLIFHNNRIYVFGGQNTEDRQLTSVYYSNINSDGSLGVWHEASLPEKYFDQDVIKVGDYVYLITGADGATAVYYALINQDGSLGTWYNTAVLLPSRQGFALATYGKYIYTIAGNSGGMQDFVNFTSVTAEHALNPWQLTTPLPEPTQDHTAIAYNAYLYVLSHSDHIYYAPINENGTLGNWETTISLPEVMSRYNLFEHQGYLYLLGGSSNVAYYTSISEDGTLGNWQSTTSLPVYRLGIARAR